MIQSGDWWQWGRSSPSWGKQLVGRCRESISWGLFGVCHGEAVTGLEAALEAADSTNSSLS